MDIPTVQQRNGGDGWLTALRPVRGVVSRVFLCSWGFGVRPMHWIVHACHTMEALLARQLTRPHAGLPPQSSQLHVVSMVVGPELFSEKRNQMIDYCRVPNYRHGS